jgi:hypothetical protein
MSQANQLFLNYARTTFDIQQLGTIATASSGGPTAQVQWNTVVPVAPAWADELIVVATVPYQFTVPAGATMYFSPFFPYNLLAYNLLLGGAPPFATPVSGTPFVLDEITSFQGYDPSYGLGSPAGIPQDQGGAGQAAGFPLPYQTGNANVVPGGTYHNTSAGSQNISGTAQFYLRIRCRRRRGGMWGYIPLGDPENRPILNSFLNPLVGNHPEDNPVQDVAAAGITGVTTGVTNVYLTWRAKQLDITPPGMSSIPQPTVGLGLTVDTNNGLAIANAGQIVQIEKRAAMIYEKMFHILVNNQQPIESSYYGLWTTGQQQSARYEFDVTQNNFQNYYIQLHWVYQRWLAIGVYVTDLVSGEIPEFPGQTPYKGLMSPDVGYAAMVGVAPTPAMYNAIRIITGVGIVGAYVRSYDFGLVTVPY